MADKTGGARYIGACGCTVSCVNRYSIAGFAKDDGSTIYKVL